MELTDKYNLVQAIEEPTRERNTLDLVFTNDISIFTHIEVTKSNLSDHNQIEISTNFKTNKMKINNDRTKYSGETDFWKLNFYNENVSWKTINQEITEIPWQTLFNNKSTETCINILLTCLLMICIRFIPKKNERSKNKIPRERKKLLNRMKMLKREKHRTHNNKSKEKIDKKIQETEAMLISHRQEERMTKEKRVIENMKDNPKVLFDYINKQKDRDTKIVPFKINNEYIYDGKEI